MQRKIEASTRRKKAMAMRLFRVAADDGCSRITSEAIAQVANTARATAPQVQNRFDVGNIERANSTMGIGTV
jgi:hypothetical protein